MKIFASAFLTLVLFITGSCGSSGSGTSSFVAFVTTLKTSAYLDGDYTASDLFTYVYRYDPVAPDWRYYDLTMDDVLLTISGNAVSGTTTLSAIDDDLPGGGTAYPNVGDTYEGWTVGTPLTISGHVDGAVLALIVTAPNGNQIRFFLAPAGSGPGDVTVQDYTAGFEFRQVDSLYGVADTTLANNNVCGGAELDDLTWVGAPSSTPAPVVVPLGKGPGIHLDGSWTGDGTTHITYFDGGGFEERDIDYDLALVISGNTVSGTATLTSTDGLADFEGYMAGDIWTVSGVQIGGVVFLEFTDPANPGFSWRHVLAPYELEDTPIEAPGGVTYLYSEYGFSFGTTNHHAGWHEIELTRM